MPRISDEIDFDSNIRKRIGLNEPVYGKEWPIVYMIYNDKEIYIGETVDASTRMSQHYDNPERRSLKKVRIISDEKFNKSAILDLEAFLISHVSADSVFERLQNGTAGQRHNYYQKEMYESEFAGVWKSLQDYGLAKYEITKIENDNLFKYSPYKTLTPDQYLAVKHILKWLKNKIKNGEDGTFIVKGGPGTGKTVLAIYLMKLLNTKISDDTGSDDEDLIEGLMQIQTIKPDFRIGIVVSMTNLRETLKQIFRDTYGLNQNMVFGPSDVAKSNETFDLLIVDEAHRLMSARNLANYDAFYSTNSSLGLDEHEGTQLDWILKKSKYQILFYDKDQSIKRTDIDSERFDLLVRSGADSFELNTQMRCIKGGNEYIDYVHRVFSNNSPEKFVDFSDKKKGLDYDFRLFSDVKKMTDYIKKKNDDVGLCRSVAGFGWPWVTKRMGLVLKNEDETNKLIKDGIFDIEIDGNKYIWNTTDSNWVGSDNSINEIGCIHTIQGFDLNYTGVIIGNELKYDLESDRLVVDRDCYYDKHGKDKTNDADLLQYILNIYSVLCTRGICGTYIYASDYGLREYLRRFIKLAN